MNVTPSHCVDVVDMRTDSLSYESSSSVLQELLPLLRCLDARLEEAVSQAQALFGEEAAHDPYRGLYVDDNELERQFTRQAGTPLFDLNGHAADESWLAPQTRLYWLATECELTPFDVDVLLIALAPELDRRYEQIYAYLQDHVERRWPTVDLVLNLLCAHAGERLERRFHFDADAVLIRHDLLRLLPDTGQPINSLLTHALKLDEQIVRFLLHQDGLDARISPFCTFIEIDGTTAQPADNALLSDSSVGHLSALFNEYRLTGRPLRLYFQGPPGVGKYRCVCHVSREIDAPLLTVDLEHALAVGIDFAQAVRLIFRHAHFYNAVLYFSRLDTLREPDKAGAYRLLTAQMAEHPGVVILAGQKPWPPAAHHTLGVVTIPFTLPDFTRRRACWQHHLHNPGNAQSPDTLNALADRFQLTPIQIAEAAIVAQTQAQLHTDQGATEDAAPSLDDLFSAARAQAGHDLATLARKIEPLYTWDDIVLPPDALRQLREISQRVVHRHTVLDTWGFDRKLALGKGINALFAGPSGTGKTMAAEIISHDLGLELYKIDLSGVVSKYIGETEKNLSQIFAVAESSNAILFFDEADALFGKRSEVRDAHDRYANVEISYLLQRMEEYAGIVILATNLRKNMDDAFVRRMHFAIEFPFPNEKHRRRIWEKIWPDATPRQADLDMGFMARRFEVAGGNIRNIALAAAFLAAEDGSAITMTHLIQATQREYQKMGKVMLAEEFGEYATLVGRRGAS